MSEAKPLRWSFLLTIPIVVAAIWGVMLILAHVERGELVQELATRVTNGSVKEAKAALEQIVEMPEPPLELMVSAAASPSRQVAQRAQSSISELVRKWQRQLAAKHRVRRIAHQLEQLAAALDVHQKSFATHDYVWLAKTTESIVRLANSAPLRVAPGLAVHCESLLALTNSHAGTSPADVVPVVSTDAASAPDSVFNPPSQTAIQSIIPDDEEDEESVEVYKADESTLPPSDDDNDDVDTPDQPLRWSQPNVNESSKVSLPPSFYRRHRAEADAASPIATVNPAPPQTIAVDPWEKIDTRSLLDRWLAANGIPKRQLARELERRGFGALRADLVRLAVSDDTTGRVQLVHDLLDLPGTGTKAWLLLFADDANVEVRLAAVNVMATSHDAQLLEKAWQVALHDHDPRIAGLAERLRDRHDRAERR